MTSGTRVPAAFVGVLDEPDERQYKYNMIITVQSYVDHPYKKQKDKNSLNAHDATSSTLERRAGSIVTIEDGTTTVNMEMTVGTFVQIPEIQNYLDEIEGHKSHLNKLLWMVETMMTRFSRTDGAYNLVRIKELRKNGVQVKQEEYDSALAEVAFRKDYCMIAKFISDMDKMGVTVTWIWDGESAIGTMIRGNDMMDFELPAYMLQWTMNDWLNKRMPRAIRGQSEIQLGAFFSAPWIIYTPIIDHWGNSEIISDLWENQVNFNRAIQVTIVRKNISPEGKHKHFVELIAPAERIMSARLADTLAKMANPKIKLKNVDWIKVHNGILPIPSTTREVVDENIRADYSDCIFDFVERSNRAKVEINAEIVGNDGQKECWEHTNITKIVDGRPIIRVHRHVKRIVPKLQFWNRRDGQNLVLTSVNRITNFTKALYTTLTTNTKIQANSLTTEVIYGFDMGEEMNLNINVQPMVSLKFRKII